MLLDKTGWLGASLLLAGGALYTLGALVYALWPTYTIVVGSTSAAALPGALLPWVCVGWIAATLALSTLWTMHLNERLRVSEREIGRLGTQADPFLAFLLRGTPVS